MPGPDPRTGLRHCEHGFADDLAGFQWRAAGAEVLTERWYAEAQRVLEHGGWTGFDPATINAVRHGARPGDPLPPLPYIADVADAEVIVTGTGQDRCVAVLFSYRHFPGGALDRMMADPPAPDSAGITWTTWGDEG